METRTPEKRSEIMRAVGSRDTTPELAVRRIAHGQGYRYSLHARDLPGTPDIVFRTRRKAIFVHGCFWHGHRCGKGRLPKTRTEYWSEKIAGNRLRDRKAVRRLKAAGWQTLTIWGCETGDCTRVMDVLVLFLGATGRIPLAGTVKKAGKQ